MVDPQPSRSKQPINVQAFLTDSQDNRTLAAAASEHCYAPTNDLVPAGSFCLPVPKGMIYIVMACPTSLTP
jgi:hypothetical protein